jgi:hypothetical protein
METQLGSIVTLTLTTERWRVELLLPEKQFEKIEIGLSQAPISYWLDPKLPERDSA